jgi:chromosome segregation ATPase
MKCENEVRHKMNVQEWKAMFNVEKTKYEGKLRTLTTEKDIVQKDRDESMMVVSRVQKEMMELKLERKLANETAVEEIKKLNEKIRLLELNLSEANSEKSALKGMISKMREEMETLTTMSSPGNQSKPSIPSMNDMNDGTSMLYMLESIFDRLDQSSSKINDSHVIAIKEVLHKICKSFNCFEEMEEEYVHSY